MQQKESAQSTTPSRTLIFRLSSLGDIVLAASALGPLSIRGQGPVDWCVSREFAPLLRGHPGIGRVWEYDRATGIQGWIRLCAELASQDYAAVLDLHSSLRTRVARAYFAYRGARAPWSRLRKQRWRLYGVYLFKLRWPEVWRPRPFAERFARLAGGRGIERADFSHLDSSEMRAQALKAGRSARLSAEPTASAGYYCVMPGSKWQGKCWPAERYLEVIRACTSQGVAVVMGGASDPQSVELVRRLNETAVPHVSGVGAWDLPQSAAVLAGARAYLGNDTGLAHLAEALGVPALVIYGPTTPEMGFGPWRPESRAVGLDGLGCRPCGKDGRRCYRPVRKYLCMTGLSAEEVAARFREMGARR